MNDPNIEGAAYIWALTFLCVVVVVIIAAFTFFIFRWVNSKCHHTGVWSNLQEESVARKPSTWYVPGEQTETRRIRFQERYCLKCNAYHRRYL